MISTRDTASLLEIVHDGASDVGREAFPSSVRSALARLIPSDACVGYQEADVAGRFRAVDQVEIVGEPPSPSVEAAFHFDSSTRPPGHGSRYRATAIGPGVAPDPYWEQASPGPFDPVREADMNRLQDELMGGDPLCRQH